MKEKRGWRVMDDKGNYYSKHPLTKKRATAQLRALYASYSRGHSLRGKGFATYVDEDDNHHIILQGNGWFSDIYSKIKSFAGTVASKLTSHNIQAASDILATGIRSNYPPAVRDVLAKYGNGQVYSLTIYREPIKSYIDNVLNILSIGGWNKAKQQLNYDKMFHLSMIASLSMPNGDKAQVKIEKNEVINITPTFSLPTNAESMPVPVPCCFTLNQMLDTAKQQVGNSFFTYDAFSNNCQVFILNILRANGLVNPTIENFVSQKAEQLVSQLPEHIPAVASLATNLAGFWNRITKGEGQPEGGIKKRRGRRRKIDPPTIMNGAGDLDSRHDRELQLFYSELLRDAKKHPDVNPFPKNRYGSLDTNASKVWDNYKQKYPLLEQEISFLHLNPNLTSYQAVADYLESRSPELLNKSVASDAIKREKVTDSFFTVTTPPINEIPDIRTIAQKKYDILTDSYVLPTDFAGGQGLPPGFTGYVKAPIIAKWKTDPNGGQTPVYKDELGYPPDKAFQVMYFVNGQNQTQHIQGLSTIDPLLSIRKDLAEGKEKDILALAKGTDRPMNADSLLEIAHQLIQLREAKKGSPLTDAEQKQVEDEVFKARYGDNKPIIYDENSKSNVSFFNVLEGEVGRPGQIAIQARKRLDGGYDIEYADGQFESTPATSEFECNTGRDGKKICGLKARAADANASLEEAQKKIDEIPTVLAERERAINEQRDKEWEGMSGWDKFVNGLSVAGTVLTDYVLPVASFIPGLGVLGTIGDVASAARDLASGGECTDFNSCTAQQIAEDRANYLNSVADFQAQKEQEANDKLLHETYGDTEASRMGQDLFYKNLTQDSTEHQDLANRIKKHGTWAMSEINGVDETPTVPTTGSGAFEMKRKLRFNAIPRYSENHLDSKGINEDETIPEIFKQPILPNPDFHGAGSVHISRRFAKDLKDAGFSPSEYLEQVRNAAAEQGYDGDDLHFSDDNEHKLMIATPDDRIIRFGRVGYGDYIIWSKLESNGEVRKGYADMKRRVFTKSHSAIKGNWKSDKYSPNMLALKILW